MFTLSWQPPYDWSWMLGFLAARAVDGVETVGEGFYARSLVVGEHRGLISVSPHLPTHTVQVSVSAGLLPVAPACLAKVSRLFDLDCQPAQIRRYAERWKPWRSYALLHIWYTHGWQPSMDSEIAGIQ